MIEVINNWRRPPPGILLPPWYPRPDRPKHRQKQEGMLWVPQKGRLLVDHNTGTTGVAAPGTSVTTGATAATKGTVAQLIASTAIETYWVTIIASDYAVAGAASEGAMDILIGAATEEVLIANLLMGHCGYVAPSTVALGPKRWDFPLYIPAGQRLAAQAAGARVSVAMKVWIFLYGGDGLPPFRTGSKVTTYGMGTVPNGTAIVPGASGGPGTFTQITAATSEDHFAFSPSFQVATDTALAVRGMALDIGIGAATEKVIGQSYWFGTDANETMVGPINSMPCFEDVPSGTRLAMRVSGSGLNDTAYNACIHAVS